MFADPEVNPKPSVQTSISGPSHFDNFSKVRFTLLACILNVDDRSGLTALY